MLEFHFISTDQSEMASRFPFDVTKPIKTGFLHKQGEKTKMLKKRFFVLYQGFLVYYKDDPDWKLDVAKGDTLEVSSNDELLANDVSSGE